MTKLLITGTKNAYSETRHTASNGSDLSIIVNQPLISQFQGLGMQQRLFTIKPASAASKEALVHQIRRDKDHLHDKLLQHGAILFRGFELQTQEDFEVVALALEPGLQNNYAGTSPRNSRTRFVHSASELPGHYPIMQHCEMSFLPSAPRYLFFFCFVEPTEGGETPVCDFRKVYAQMDPTIRSEFEERGLRLVRNYSGPKSRMGRDVFQLKRWDELFKTTKREAVEVQCLENGLRFTWLPDDRLRLVNETSVSRRHPETNELAWFNHLQVFHREAAAIEYEHIFKRRKDLFSLNYLCALKLLTWCKRWFKKPVSEAMHMTFADGGEIPHRHVRHVQGLIWANLVADPWQLGDILMIDNFTTSHGRLPFRGQRDILVAWSA